MLLIGHILTVIDYSLCCFSRFMRTKLQILVLDLLVNVMTILSLFCFKSFSGMYSLTIGLILVIIGNIKEIKQKKWTPLFIMFGLAYVSVLMFSYEGVSTIFVFSYSIINLISIWFCNPQ